MSTFRPNRNGRVCVLNFDDKFTFELPLHEETSRKLAKIAERQIEATKKMNPEDENAFDVIFNSSIDAIDEILGEGAGDKIMSLYEKPSLFDVADVINYISETYSGDYRKALGENKKAGIVPPSARRTYASY